MKENMSKCPKCKGDGIVGSEEKICKKCNGAGEIQVDDFCPNCGEELTPDGHCFICSLEYKLGKAEYYDDPFIKA